MEIFETSFFSRQVDDYLTAAEYRSLQIELVKRPDCGTIISGGGGIRKARWSYKGHGKRGGIRIIYYWFTTDHQLLCLYMYPKNVQDDLTPKQLKFLRSIVESELKSRHQRGSKS